MRTLAAILAGIKFFCFILASILSLLRYKKDHGLTNVCLFMAIALFVFGIYSVLDMFSYLGGYEIIIENIRDITLIVGSVFLLVSVLCVGGGKK